MKALLATAILLSAFAPPCHADEFCLPVDARHHVRGVIEEAVERPINVTAVIVPGTGSLERHGHIRAPGESAVEWRLYDSMAASLLRHGISVARFDAPSPVASGVHCAGPTASGPAARSLRLQQRAVATIVDHVRARHPAGRVVLLGHSQGGLVAADLAGDGNLRIDGIFTYGTTLRPVREFTHHQRVALKVWQLRMLMQHAVDRCVTNEVIGSEPASTSLLRTDTPIAFWMSPTGSWCEHNLHEFVARATSRADAVDRAVASCREQGDQANFPVAEPSGTQLMNSCEEISLFLSPHTLADRLKAYAGIVVAVAGSNDPMLDLPAEGEHATKFVAERPAIRAFHVIAGAGHILSREALVGAVHAPYADELAKHVADAMGRRREPDGQSAAP